MARCGCNSNCSCRVDDTSCVNVTGIGSPISPYKVNVLVDTTTISCGANGLQRKITTQDTNTVDISGDGSVANPLKMDVILTTQPNIPDPDALNFPNLIKELPGVGGGIYVSCEDIQDCVGAALATQLFGRCIIYDDVANSMTLRICPDAPGGNGIECIPVGDAACPAGGLAVIPSSDPNNSLIIGTDGRLYTPPFTVQAGPCLQPFTQAGTPSDPFVVAPQVAPELNGLECIVGQGLAVIPSSDFNNALTFGSDQRLYANLCLKTLPSTLIVGQDGPCFESTGDGCITPYTINVRLSNDTCQGLCCRADGLFAYQNFTSLPAPQGLFSENWSAGPFNGSFPNQVIMAPRCLTITNPSACKTLLVNSLFGGVVDLQKTSGNFVISFETSINGVGGPWVTSVSAAALDPDPPTPQTSRAVYTLNGDTRHIFELAPGASRQICVRIEVNGFFLVNGRINNSDRSFAAGFEWGQALHTCP